MHSSLQPCLHFKKHKCTLVVCYLLLWGFLVVWGQKAPQSLPSWFLLVTNHGKPADCSQRLSGFLQKKQNNLFLHQLKCFYSKFNDICIKEARPWQTQPPTWSVSWKNEKNCTINGSLHQNRGKGFVLQCGSIFCSHDVQSLRVSRAT